MTGESRASTLVAIGLASVLYATGLLVKSEDAFALGSRVFVQENA